LPVVQNSDDSICHTWNHLCFVRHSMFKIEIKIRPLEEKGGWGTMGGSAKRITKAVPVVPQLVIFMRNALFWVITQRVVVISGTTRRSHLRGSSETRQVVPKRRRGIATTRREIQKGTQFSVYFMIGFVSLCLAVLSCVLFTKV
jgi:hypothetical protein